MSKIYKRPAIDGRVIDLENVIIENGFFVTKGTLGGDFVAEDNYADVTPEYINPEIVEVGYRYKVLKDGTYNKGTQTEIIAQEGDYIYCSKKEEIEVTLGNIQIVITWALSRPFTVEGPASSIENTVPIFSNKNGNKIKDSMYTIASTVVTEDERIIAVQKDIELHNLDLLAHSQYIPDTQLDSASKHSVENRVVYSSLDALDHRVVHLEGNETIYGVKNFANTNESGGTIIRHLKTIDIIDGVASSAVRASDADHADKLGYITVGSYNQPIYLSSGLATAFSSSIGNERTPIFVNKGHITAFSEIENNTIGSEERPIYLRNGGITAFTKSIGGIKNPVYVHSGVIKPVTEVVGSPKNPVYVNSGVFTACNETVGTSNNPVYISNGEYTPVSETVGNTSTPIFINEGKPTIFSATIGSPIKHIYFKDGVVVEPTSSIGSEINPVYMKQGEITAVSSSVGTNDHPVYIQSGKFTALDCNIGNTTTPVYMSSGHIKQTAKSFDEYLPLSGGTMTGKIIGNITSADHATTAEFAEKYGSETIGNIYTPVYVDNGIIKTTVYSFNDFVPISGGTFSGNVSFMGDTTGITVSTTDSSTKFSTTEYVKNVVSEVVDNAPYTLNTLNKLAQAINNDPQYHSTITDSMALKAFDSEVVHNSGMETIDGAKTFTTLITGTITSAQIADTALVVTSATSAIFANMASNASNADNALNAINAESAVNATSAVVATKLGSTNVGNPTTPVYISSGSLLPTSKSFNDYLPLTGGTMTGKITGSITNADTATNIGTGNIGNAHMPVYVEDGVVKPTHDAFFQFLPLYGGVMDGGLYEKSVILADNNIDFALGNCFVKTIDSNTSLYFSGLKSGAICSVLLINGGNYTITWPSNIRWENNTAPNFTENGQDMVTFISYDGLSIWGALAGLNMQ